MNQVFAGTAALVLTLILWSLGKRPGQLIPKEGNSHNAFREQTQSPITLVEPYEIGETAFLPISSPKIIGWEAPTTVRERLKLKKRLQHSMTYGPSERLEAVTLAGLWGDKSVLPILKRGLKDSDSLIVIAAAKAIERHRGAPKKNLNSQAEVRPPRNVSRMR